MTLGRNKNFRAEEKSIDGCANVFSKLDLFSNHLLNHSGTRGKSCGLNGRFMQSTANTQSRLSPVPHRPGKFTRHFWMRNMKNSLRAPGDAPRTAHALWQTKIPRSGSTAHTKKVVADAGKIMRGRPCVSARPINSTSPSIESELQPCWHRIRQKPVENVIVW